jgi:hypothetical protein
VKKVKIALIIEKSEEMLWGRVSYNDNLITESASNLSDLQKKFFTLLDDFEGLKQEQIELEYFYDVYSLFQQFDFLNITKVAVHANMNPSLLRQYASGVKNPSAEQASKIESTLHSLAEELRQAQVLVS